MPAFRVCLCAAVCLAPMVVGQDRDDSEIPRSARSRVLTEATAVDRARVIDVGRVERIPRNAIEVGDAAARLDEWDLTDLKGRDVRADLEPQVEGTTLRVRSSPLRQFVMKPKKVQKLELVEPKAVVLPGGIVSRKPQSGGGRSPAGLGVRETAEQLGWYRLTLLASPLPADWEPETGFYATDVTLGLREPEGGAGGPLEEPVTVRMSYDGLIGDDPPEVRIGGPGLANEQSFTLRFRPTTPEPILRLRSSISDADLTLRAVPRLAVHSDRSEILGFGLEKAALTVEKLLPYGQRAVSEAPERVVVGVQGRAQVEPSSVAFAEGPAQTQFSVRSAGLGALPIQVAVGGLSGEITINQSFPFGPLVAVLLGGALGGYARRFLKGSRSNRIGRWVTEGLVVGVIAFVAGVLGVGYLNLPPAVVATEAGAFLTGALCGFVGVTLLEKATASGGR